MKDGFIGGGNMGGAMARAAIAAVGAERVLLVDRDEETTHILSSRIGAVPSDYEQIARECRLIFVGVKPYLVAQVLEQLRPGVLIVDLASRPGGVDWKAAKDLGIKAVHALALPGQLTPVSGALAIQHAIYHLCEEAYHAR